jgi:hypothetical protein
MDDSISVREAAMKRRFRIGVFGNGLEGVLIEAAGSASGL